VNNLTLIKIIDKASQGQSIEEKQHIPY
jgi:hypothetical protein